ncbi:MAG: hypothetical protein H6607_05965 [Flavobacteriales bacterium]|nr:hypothetical protein [Flavobacteriales bacterium]
MEVSSQLQAVEESQTLVMTKKARELAETGVKVINLSIGEPDFNTLIITILCINTSSLMNPKLANVLPKCCQ